MRYYSLFLWVGFCAGVMAPAACGCAGSGGGSGSDGDTDGDTDGDDDDDDDNNDEDYDPVKILPENMIDDFEDGNGGIIFQVGRTGYWYTYHDESDGGEQTPVGEEFLPEKCGMTGSDYCARTTGSGFTEWGAGIGAPLRDLGDECDEEALPHPYDAAVFDGIAFNAKGNCRVFVKLAVPEVIPEEFGGTCDPSSEECDDVHGRTIELTDQWRQYPVRFDDSRLKQGGWGKEADFDPGELLFIQFEVLENVTFDFSVDEVGFFAKDESETNEETYPDENEGPSDRVIMAGFRSSHYGAEQGMGYFPAPEQWAAVATEMAGYVDGKPTGLWIICNAMDGGYCSWETGDDEWLNYFDGNGIGIILQVEPMDEDIESLIDEAMDLYGDHPSVIGFGVDVEFYKPDSSNDNLGKEVTDEEASAWLGKVKEYNSDYILMLKHFDLYKMPPCAREGMLFINDSQDDSEEAIIRDYEEWADLLAPHDVGFQIGYEADESWWSTYDTPPEALGVLLAEQNKNTAAVFWVDFTLDQVFDL